MILQDKLARRLYIKRVVKTTNNLVLLRQEESLKITMLLFLGPAPIASCPVAHTNVFVAR